jgi:hypothetical protein
MERVRRFSFNIHNYQEKGYTAERLVKEFSDAWKIDYMIVGQEITQDNQIHHLQGYVEFSSPTTWEQVRQRFVSTIGYVSDLQISKGDGESNYKYCSKSGTYTEYGSRSLTVKTDDIAINVIQLITQGYSLVEIMTNNKNYTHYIIRNYPNLFKIQLDMYNQRKINVDDKDLPF